jgi:ubiquinone/menaquinone biosynthesis C-methylase UbiE
MTSQEPSSLEVLITVAVGNLFNGVYRTAVDRLKLRGNERVLDFGSGAGTPARFLARELAEGGGTLTCVDVSQVWMETAQKRLKRHSNVTFHLGEISALDIPDGSHDVIFIHFTIHDMLASERPRAMKHLARKLVIGGRLYVREPLNVIAQDEIRRLMQQNGLAEVQADVGNVPLMGATYEGIFVKKEQGYA